MMSAGDAGNEYFESYEDLEVHKLMLDDKPRTLAYKNAIFAARDKFEKKVVMDVGAGTGILSVFCAQAGASKVYAIEANVVAETTREVVAENNLQDKIEVIQKRVEDLEESAVEKVDIIVSEWMGFYLVHEGMLDSVLLARDRFLKEDGIMFPNVAKIYAAPCQLPSLFEFWDDVYGVSMKSVGKKQRHAKSVKPEILTVHRRDLLATGRLLSWLDLSTMKLEELNTLAGEDSVLPAGKNGRFQGVCVWFSVEFPDGSELSTSPMDEATHWKQTAVVLPEDKQVEEGEPIAFRLKLSRNVSNPRWYNMELDILDAEVTEHNIPCSCYMTKCIVTRTYLEEADDDITDGDDIDHV